MNHLKNNSGFTMIEMMVTAAVALILTSLAMANINEWILSQKLKSTCTSLMNAVRIARSTAVQRNAMVVIAIDVVNFKYYVFIDANTNWIYDSGSDTLITSGTFPKNVLFSSISFSDSTNSQGYEVIRFNTVGRAQKNQGGNGRVFSIPEEIKLRDTKNRYYGIRINQLGTNKIIKSSNGTTWQ